MLPDRPSLLAVATVHPWPARDGYSLRVSRLLDHLAARWEITLVAPAASGGPALPPGVTLVPVALPGTGVTYPWRFDSAALAEAVRRATAGLRHDRALVWPGAETLDAELPPGVADLIDCNALEFARGIRFASGLRERLRTLRELGLAVRDGRRAARRAGVITLVGETDAAWQRRLSRADRVHVVPNGVDLPPLVRAEHVAPTLAFTGTLDYPPNVDAARWLATEIWPRIRARVPAARLLVAGRRPAAAVAALDGRDGIEVRADVADMAAVLGEAWATIAPMREGLGIKNKILESWAAGRPAVMTPMATNGLSLPPGHAGLVARTPDALASAVATLMGDAAGRHAMGAAAQAHVARDFTWAAAADRIDALLRAV